MTSRATTTDDYPAVLDGLARTLRTRRPDCPPRELLSYDRPGHSDLVGIRSAASVALLHLERNQYAIAVGIGSEGLDDYGLEVADSTADLRFDRWLAAKRSRWSGSIPDIGKLPRRPESEAGRRRRIGRGGGGG